LRNSIIDEKLEPKESYRTLDRLVNQEWKTRLTAKTGAQGVFRFRGFYGKYAVKVSAGGHTQEFQIDLAKDGRATHQLTFKP
jgi:hypothetical protein